MRIFSNSYQIRKIHELKLKKIIYKYLKNSAHALFWGVFKILKHNQKYQNVCSEKNQLKREIKNKKCQVVFKIMSHYLAHVKRARYSQLVSWKNCCNMRKKLFKHIFRYRENHIQHLKLVYFRNLIGIYKSYKHYLRFKEAM